MINKKSIIIILVIFSSLINCRQEMILFYVKNIVRKTALPTQKVEWEKPGLAEVSGNPKKLPNIILIVADDLGINDLTINGGGIAGGTVPTPHINSLGKEGVHFTKGYSGNATCAPSRAAMMTGRYPTRYGFEFTPVPINFSRVIGKTVVPNAIRKPILHSELISDSIPYEEMGLPVSEITVAKILQSINYHTVHIGKWHLGENPKYQPNSHGFHESLGFMPGASMFLPENHPDVVNAKQDYDPIDKFLWAAHPWQVRYNGRENFQPSKYLTDYLTDEAITVIDNNKNRPFFLYLAYNAPHTPLQSTKEDYEALSHIKDHTMRVYAAMIRSLDRNIGRILSELKNKGLSENTLIIFTSDNGGAHYIGLEDINKPYRGWKATFFEGGIRVPFYMKWPNKIKPNTIYNEPVSHIDLFSSILGAVEQKLPTDRQIDGVNLLSLIGKPNTEPHETLYWKSGGYRTIQSKYWKLQVADNPGKEWLFNLKEDPTEQKNLASVFPDKLAELKKVLLEYDKKQSKPLWPSILEAPIAIDKPMNRPQSKDDEVIYWSN